MSLKSFRGTIYEENRCILLRICSRNLYKRFVGKKFSVESFANGRMILKKDLDGMRFLESKRDKSVLRLSITRWIKKKFRGSAHIIVAFNGVSTDRIVQHNVASSSSSPVYIGKDLPKDVYWVNGFVRKANKGLKITLYRKILFEISKERDVRVLFQPNDGGILLRRCLDVRTGRKLSSQRRLRETTSYETEISFPEELKGKFNGKIGIPLKEFGISLTEFCTNEIERTLLAELIRRGVDAYPGTTQTQEDIILKNGGYVEVTSLNTKRKDSRHYGGAMNIRGKLFEAEHMSTHRKIHPIFFVIHSDWLKNKYLVEEAREAEKHDVYTIFTDFGNRWERKAAGSIVSRLGK